MDKAQVISALQNSGDADYDSVRAVTHEYLTERS